MKSKGSYPKFKPHTKPAWAGELNQQVRQWVLSGFIVMHMTANVIAAIALVSAHVGEHAVFIRGFNHYVANHLFPIVSHGHYRRITQMICAMDKKYRLNYKSVSLEDSLRTHFRLLKNNSIKPTELFHE